MTYKQFYKRLDEEIVEQIRDKKDDNYLGFRLRTEIKESAQLKNQTPTRTQSQLVDVVRETDGVSYTAH